MVTKEHTYKGNSIGNWNEAESMKELIDEVGKEQAFAYANRGWVIAQQNTNRLGGKESKTAKMRKLLALIKENPDIAEAVKEKGVDLSEL